MIYLAIAALLVYLIYRYDYCSVDQGKKVWTIIVWVIFILVAGLKYKLGSDTFYYLQFYEKLKPITEITWEQIIETRYMPGFVVLNSIFRYFTPDFTAFQIFHAVIVCSSIFLFLHRNARHMFFALFLFFLFQYTLFFYEQIRESLSVAIFLFAWPSFVKRQWWKWYMWSALAIMFHISSIVMLVLPMITLPGVRQLFVFGPRIWFIALGILLVGFLVQRVFFKYILLLEVAEAVSERAAIYADSKLSSGTFNVMGALSHCFIYVLYPVMSLYFSKKNRKLKEKNVNEPVDNDIASMTLMSVYVSLLSITIAILGRYNNYFFIFSILTISNLAFTYIPILGKVIRLKYIYWMLLFLPFIGWNFNNRYLGNLNKSGTLKSYMLYYPYSSCFDQTIDKDREACIKYGRKFHGR